MNANATLAADFGRTAPVGRTLDIRETIGGYVVAEAKGKFDSSLLAEASLKFFGLCMVLASGALWLLPDAVFRGDALFFRLSLTAAFMATGLALYWYANQGFSEEVQVDTSRREIRLATRNSRESARTRQRIAMRDVESCFIRRNGQGGTSQLCLRLRGVLQPLAILRAPERELAELHRRLAQDTRAPRERIAARAA